MKHCTMPAYPTTIGNFLILMRELLIDKGDLSGDEMVFMMRDERRVMTDVHPHDYRRRFHPHE